MNTIVIAANLGHLKAYRIIETPNRGRKLHLLIEMNFPEAHGHYVDKVTDMAGRFPVSGSAGQQVQMSTAEAMKVELEATRRLNKLVAEQIETILKRERPEWWHFAAPSDCHQAILNEITPDLRMRVRRDIHADLTKTPIAEIMPHLNLTY